MGKFNWIATNKRTKQTGGRESTNPDINTVEDMEVHLRAAFPYVDVSDVVMVDAPEVLEPAGAGIRGGVPRTMEPVPIEDFVHDIDAARKRAKLPPLTKTDGSPADVVPPPNA